MFSPLFSVLEKNYRVVATDYDNFAIEYNCQDNGLVTRNGKNIVWGRKSGKSRYFSAADNSESCLEPNYA